MIETAITDNFISNNPHVFIIQGVVRLIKNQYSYRHVVRLNAILSKKVAQLTNRKYLPQYIYKLLWQVDAKSANY